MDLIITIIGWLSAFGLLIAYILLSFNLLQGQGVTYHLINGICSIGLGINALCNEVYPFVLLNTVWAIISAITIFRIIQKPKVFK